MLLSLQEHLDNGGFLDRSTESSWYAKIDLEGTLCWYTKDQNRIQGKVSWHRIVSESWKIYRPCKACQEEQKHTCNKGE